MASHGSIEDDDDARFVHEWRRFRRVYWNRRRQLQREKETIDPSARRRVFLLAQDEEQPWQVFALATHLELSRRVYETAALHFSPLHDACASGRIEQARQLIESCGACTLAEDSCGRIALHHAVIREQFHTVQYLLGRPDARRQLHARDHRHACAVHYVLEKLQRISRKEFPGVPPARKTIELRSRSVRYRRLWELADAMLPLMEPITLKELRALDDASRGDAWDAARLGDVDRLQQIFTLYPDADHRLSFLGRTLLHEACESPRGDARTLLLLLEQSPRDQLATDMAGATPLHYAAARGRVEACVLLLDDDALASISSDSDELLMAVDGLGRTPLHWSLYHHSRSCRSREDAITTARFLLQRCPSTLHVTDAEGYSPLHLAIVLGDRELVELMINLGASVYARPINTQRGEYGKRATWAPCGLRFQQRRRIVKPVPLSDAEATSSSSELVVKSGSLQSRSSIVCERLRRVKAGQVEHPGEALPMETLWFWVHRKTDGRHQDPSPPHEDTRTALPTDAEEGVDAGRHGCRQFGAVCDQCREIPGADGANDGQRGHSYESILSPLTLALRCCRLAASLDQRRGRLAIAQALILAGAPVAEEELAEGLHLDQDLSVLDLVLAHSPRHVEASDVMRSVYSSSDPVTHSASALRLAEALDGADLLKVVPWLFRYEYFLVLEEMMRQRPRAARDIMQAVPETPTKNHRWRRLRHQAVDTIIKWMELWPEHSQVMAEAVVRCVDEVIRKPPRNMTPAAREQVDGSIQRAIEVVLLGGAANVESSIMKDAMVISWTQAAIANGWLNCCRTLQQYTSTNVTLVLKMVRELEWPLRSQDAAHSNDLHTLALDLLKVAAESADDGAPQVLQLAARHDLHKPVLDRLISGCGDRDLLHEACHQLCTRAKHKSTALQELVTNGHLELVGELLALSDRFETERGIVWAGVVATVVSHSRTLDKVDDWINLLTRFARSDDLSVEFILMKAMPRSIRATESIVRWLSSQLVRQAEEDIVGWVQTHNVLYHVAWWNAVGFFSSFASNETITTSVWERLANHRHPLDHVSPLELCELLGHAQLAVLMRAFRPDSSHPSHSLDEAEDRLPVLLTRHQVGLLRTMMSLQLDVIPPVFSARMRMIDPLKLFQGDWLTAVSLDDVRALSSFRYHEIPLPSGTLVNLIETAIRHGCLASLIWILDLERTRVTDVETSRLLLGAAKHASHLHSTIVWLLLSKYNFHPGRLSGDGTNTTLLHYAAALADSTIASQTIDTLLQVEGSDVNVRDGFGWTPVACAIASGQITTAVKLMNLQATRLEAEYEGQTTLYYTLHLLPSFAWRWVAEVILKTARSSAFLHCTSEDCACKGFEHGVVDGECSFCNHPRDGHSRVPYPPWFRDQYETYMLQPHEEDEQEHHDHVDEEDEEEEEAARHRRRLMEAEVVDESVIEKQRGRLGEWELLRILQLRFPHLLHDRSIVTLLDDALRVATPSSSSRDDWIEDTALLEASLHDVSVPSPLPEVEAALSVCLATDARTQTCSIDPANLPVFLRCDAAMLHGDSCLCLRDATTPQAQLSFALHRWVSLAVSSTRPSLCTLSLLSALAHWRRVTSVGPTSSTKRLHMAGPHVVTRDPQRHVSILHLFLFHWRFARVYQCFHRWRRRSRNAQVVHHELETLAESWHAEERQGRLQALVARQRELEALIKGNMLLQDMMRVTPTSI